jgi:putative DNA primase/helicase
MPKTPKKVMPKKSKPLAKVASTIKSKKTNWVWEGRIAKGRVTVIAGDPGIGKSQIAAKIAATVSRGGKWPCGEGSAPEGDVLMLISEDDHAERSRPLLVAANANLRRVHVIGDYDDQNGKPINLFDETDRERIGDEIARTRNPQLIIIDPITAFSDSRINNGTAVRQLLAELTRGAKYYDIAVVLICHLTKSGGRNALAMIANASAIGAAARAVYLVTDGEPGSKWCVLACVKTNVGPLNIALQYRIKRERVEGGIATSRVAWNKTTLQMTADEALARAKVNGVKRPPPRPVDEFLKGLLSDGKRAVSEIVAKGQASGLTKKQLDTAAKHLAVVKTNTGYGSSKKFFWELPATAKKPG